MTAEKWLVYVLRTNAAVMILAMFAVVMPFAWMSEVHYWFGMGELPDSPIVAYLTRSLSALYSLTGIWTMIISFDSKRYHLLVTVWGVSAIGFGLVILAIDLAVGMPRLWTLCEAPYVIPLGCIVLWLQRLADKQVT